MNVSVKDIPPEGLSISFELPLKALQDRVLPENLSQEQSLDILPFYFETSPKASLLLRLEGSTVVADGEVLAEFKTVCARCAEDTIQQLAVPIHMVLKPATGIQKGDEQDDVGFGTYDGKEIKTVGFTEDHLVLALPFNAFCKADCKGLCVGCGANLNLSTCQCGSKKKESKVEESEGDERFKVLRGLKIH